MITDDDDRDEVHVALIEDVADHDTEHGANFWCDPEIFDVCDECEDGCWRCDEGKRPYDPTSGAAMLIVHRAKGEA